MTTKSQKLIVQVTPQIKCFPENYFGKALKELREDKNLTQKEAADLVGIEQTQWSAYELGKRKPNLDTILAMAIGIKFDPLELITRTLVKSKYFSSIEEVPFNIKGKDEVRAQKTSHNKNQKMKISYS